MILVIFSFSLSTRSVSKELSVLDFKVRSWTGLQNQTGVFSSSYLNSVHLADPLEVSVLLE